MEVVEFKPYFKAINTTIKSLNASLHDFVPFIESYLNNYLTEGVSLPALSELKSYMKNITISTHEGILLIDGQATLEEDNTEEDSEVDESSEN